MGQDLIEEKLAGREMKQSCSGQACIPRGFMHVVPRLHPRQILALAGVSLKGSFYLKGKISINTELRHMDPEEERD